MALPRSVHITGIGNPVCSCLAIYLKSKGVQVSGSDINFSEYAAKQLTSAGIMPQVAGWSEEKIATPVEIVVTGPGVKGDNPEVKKAQATGIPVYAYPELVYQLTQDKQRIVVTGNRGRANLTALLIHVLQHFGRPVDYLAETPISWLNNCFKLSDAPVIIIEGTDTPISSGATKAVFLHYQHHIASITSISWETPNHYATQDDYVAQFDALADSTPKAGILLYNENDTLASVIGAKQRTDVTSVPFKIHPHTSESGKHYVLNGQSRVQVKVFGTQNFESISAAKELLKRIGLPAEQFYEALPYFTF